MKVKRVLSLAAENLGREDLVHALNDCAGEPSGELASLLRCYNLTENEIALDYFPLKKQERLTVFSGEIAFSRFSLAPVTVYGVQDKRMRPVPFEMRPARLLVVGQKDGDELTVTYSYSPREKGIDSCSEFGGKISARLLSFGVCFEFCLSCGQFSEAAVWEKRYREAIRAADTERRSLRLRARRWV